MALMQDLAAVAEGSFALLCSLNRCFTAELMATSTTDSSTDELVQFER